MEITYTSPIVFTSDSSKIISQMEVIGFKVTHKKENAGGTGVVFISMKDNKHKYIITSNMRDEYSDYIINYSNYSPKDINIMDNSGLIMLNALKKIALNILIKLFQLMDLIYMLSFIFV